MHKQLKWSLPALLLGLASCGPSAITTYDTIEKIVRRANQKYAEAKDLKQQKKEEKEAELLGTQAFRYWEETEINHPKMFKKRIQLYYSQTQDISVAIQGLIDEKIGTMEKLYKKSYPKLKDTVGEEYTKQMALLSGDLNRLSDDIKKLYYYGR